MLHKEYNAKRVKHRIERLNEKIKHYEDKESQLSDCGYVMYGYLKGVLSELENILDILGDGK